MFITFTILTDCMVGCYCFCARYGCLILRVSSTLDEIETKRQEMFDKLADGYRHLAQQLTCEAQVIT